MSDNQGRLVSIRLDADTLNRLAAMNTEGASMSESIRKAIAEAYAGRQGQHACADCGSPADSASIDIPRCVACHALRAVLPSDDTFGEHVLKMGKAEVAKRKKKA